MIITVVKTYAENLETEQIEHTGFKVTLDNDTVIFVPKVEGNRHYQEVLQWVANGNEIGEPE